VTVVFEQVVKLPLCLSTTAWKPVGAWWQSIDLNRHRERSIVLRSFEKFVFQILKTPNPIELFYFFV